MNRRFGEKFLQLRRARGLSRSETAIKLNVSPQQISKYESVLDMPKLKTVEKICQVFGVQLEYFFSDQPTAAGIAPSHVFCFSGNKFNTEDCVSVPLVEPKLIDATVDIDDEGISYVEEYVWISKSLIPGRNPRRLLCYRVPDDSMIPVLRHGALVCVDLDDSPSGSNPPDRDAIYRVRVDHEHVVFRHIVLNGPLAMVIALHPDHTMYPPLQVDTRSRLKNPDIVRVIWAWSPLS